MNRTENRTPDNRATASKSGQKSGTKAKRRKRAKRGSRTRGLIIAAAALVCIAAASVALTYYRTYMRANVTKEGQVCIYRNFTYDDVCREIERCGIVEDNDSFLRAASQMGLKECFKPGFYIFRKGSDNKSIVRAIANGWQTPVKLVVRGYCRTLEDFAGFLGRKMEADSAAFMEAFDDAAIRSRYGFSEQDFIGMFIPDTYEVWWTLSPEDFIERMHREYDNFWAGSRQDKADSIGLSRKEVSTLASIVTEESKYVPELPQIAGVYMNRLKCGMPLQADPTVKYALADPTIRRILNQHLKVDSPYNTYRHTGLPPGPITMPPVAAIDAVLNYSRHNYLYFCANAAMDGRHSFAVTLSQHQKNADAYHNALRKSRHN